MLVHSININELKSDLRNLKLNQLFNDTTFTPDIKKVKKGKNLIFNTKYWSILNKYKGESVITGSLALYAFGLIDRIPKDVDLLVSELPASIDICRNKYIGMEREIDMLGFTTINKTNVDFFKWKDDDNFIRKDEFLFHNPIQIIECKFKILEKINNLYGQKYKRLLESRNKDIEDIIYCFTKLIPDYKIPMI